MLFTIPLCNDRRRGKHEPGVLSVNRHRCVSGCAIDKGLGLHGVRLVHNHKCVSANEAKRNTTPDVNSVAPGQAVGDQSGTTGGFFHALLWNATGVTDLNPTNLSGFNNSLAYASNGIQQVGYGYGIGTQNISNALLWTGTANSAVDLNPNKLGVSGSVAYGTNGTQQVGYGNGSGTGHNDHAVLWTGTAASAVDLNPTNLSGITNSYAWSTDGTQQVGWGNSGGVTADHALLWTGTAASAVDLNPININGVVESQALGISGNQEVGVGIGNDTAMGIPKHALLWTGSAGSVVDLSPANAFDSAALATNGSQQVGYADDGVMTFAHAMLWSGTATSGVDLQALLPSTIDWISSSADFIDASGNIYGIATEEVNVTTFPPTPGTQYTIAVEWSPVPEPNAVSLLLIAGGGSLMHRKRKQLA